VGSTYNFTLQDHKNINLISILAPVYRIRTLTSWSNGWEDFSLVRYFL